MEEYLIQTVAFAILLLYPVWRIHKRTGLNSVLSPTVLLPLGSVLVSGLILGLSTWKLGSKIEGEK